MDLLQSFLALSPLERRRKHKEFLHALFDAVADGKLTESEIAVIESLRDMHGITEKDVRPMRVQLYAAALRAVSEDAEVTDAEWTEMLKIQQFLGIEDREIAQSKKELLRLHMQREIAQGNLPLIRPPAGLSLAKNEIAHWTCQGRIGNRTVELILTSARVIVRGKLPEVIRIVAMTGVTASGDEFSVTHGKNGLLHVRFSDSSEARMLAMLLRQIIRARNR